MANVGRPKQDIVKQDFISIRVLPEQKEEIALYAKEQNLTQTQVLLNGFRLLKEQKKSKAEEQGIHSSQEIVR